MSAMIEVRDALQLLVLGGGLAAIYAKITSSQVATSTKLDALSERVARMEGTRDTPGDSLSEVREKQADHEARIKAMERAADRPSTGSHPSWNADNTGPHKVVP